MSLAQFELTEAEERARQRVIFALDYPRLDLAISAAEDLGGLVGHFKIGLELMTVALDQGYPIVRRIHEFSPNRAPNTFLDPKYHDTPQTVLGAARAAARMAGISMFNIHISGGEVMCRYAIDGVKEGATEAGHDAPYVIGVTELTSMNDELLKGVGVMTRYVDLVRQRTEKALEWGLDGIVCPAKLAGQLEREFGSDLLFVTPGVKWGGIHGDGQEQLYTPDRAVQDCSTSRLVIGSAIRIAEDRRQTAYDILQAMAPHA